MKSQTRILLLILTVVATLFTANNQISKVDNYAESIEFGQNIIHSQIQGLQEQNGKLQNEIAFLKSSIKKEHNRTNKLLGIDGRYDTNNILVSRKNLDKFLNYRLEATSAIDFTLKSGRSEVNIHSPSVTAPAIVIGKYVLMTSHTNDAEMIKNIFLSRVPESVKIEILRHTVFMVINKKPVVLKEIYRNREKDFSFYEFPEGVVAKNFPFLLGKSDELEISDFIFMNGRPNGGYLVARPGYVTALDVSYKDVDDGYQKHTEKFGISQVTLEGDSGSPIIAFRDGKPELVGIIFGYVGEGGNAIRSLGLRINAAIDELKEKMGIDLRKIQKEALGIK